MHGIVLLKLHVAQEQKAFEACDTGVQLPFRRVAGFVFVFVYVFVFVNVFVFIFAIVFV